MHHSNQRRGFQTNFSEDYYSGRYRLDREPSVHSDSVASNLTGPGRTLDNLFVALGRPLEDLLGRFAERLGKGPHQTGVRIDRRLSQVKSLPSGSRKLEGKINKVEKDLKKLVKYTGSVALSTQVQALDQIIRLAVEDDWVRESLLTIGADQVVEQLWKSYLSDLDPILLSRSRKALISLVDTEVNNIAKRLRAEPNQCDEKVVRRYYKGYTVTYSKTDNLRDLMNLVSDPDRAWLVIRHLHLSLTGLCGRCWWCTHRFRDVLPFEEAVSENVEWSTLDVMFESSTNNFIGTEEYSTRDREPLYWCPLLEFILRHSSKLPRTINSKFFSWLSAYDCTEYGIDFRHACLTVHLFRGIAAANGVAEDDVFGLDYETLRSWYSDDRVQPLVRRITCPPEALFNRFIAQKYRLSLSTVNFVYYWGDVLDAGGLAQLCAGLSRCKLSDDEMTRQSALRVFGCLLALNVYTRNAALLAASGRPFSRTHEFAALVESSRQKCLPSTGSPGFTTLVTRHLDDNGKLLHIEPYDRTKWCHVKEGSRQTIFVRSDEVVRLRIHRGTAFSSDGFHPIFAGITSSGEKAYLSGAGETGSCHDKFAIIDGTKPEDVSVTGWAGARLILDELSIYVLRYAPDAYPRDTTTGVDPTGPYSWKPSKHQPGCQCRWFPYPYHDQSEDSGLRAMSNTCGSGGPAGNTSRYIESTDEQSDYTSPRSSGLSVEDSEEADGSDVDGYQDGEDDSFWTCEGVESSIEDWATVNDWESVDITDG